MSPMCSSFGHSFRDRHFQCKRAGLNRSYPCQEESCISSIVAVDIVVTFGRSQTRLQDTDHFVDRFPVAIQLL